jgi:hypothetical protein
MQISKMIPEGKKERRIFIVKAVAILLLVIFVIFTWRCVVPSKKYEGAQFSIHDSEGRWGSSSGYVAYTTHVPFGRMRIVSSTGVVYEAQKKYIEIYKDGEYLYNGYKAS